MYKIIIIAILLLLLLYNKKDNFEDNSKISVLILSYNRPYNLKKSLPILNKYKIIDEIIVLHGNPKYYQNFNKTK